MANDTTKMPINRENKNKKDSLQKIQMKNLKYLDSKKRDCTVSLPIRFNPAKSMIGI